MKQYFDMISLDTSYKTIWDIYSTDNVREVCGYVIMIDTDDGKTIYTYGDFEKELYNDCKSLKEAFSHFGITNWDIPLYLFPSLKNSIN